MIARFIGAVVRWCSPNKASSSVGIENTISPESREARLMALALKRVV